jgi:hypothetical protein
MRRLLGLSLALAALGATPAHAADEAKLDRSSPIAAYGGRLAWSAYDAATKRYALVTKAGGVVTPVPVATRPVPFDVDLGPGESGDTVAVYSRCRRDPGRSGPTGNAIIGQFPDWRTGRGCDVFQFHFASGRESRLRRVSSSASSEFLPSIWTTRIAFSRVYERRRGRAGDRAHLYLGPVSGSRGLRRLPAGPRARLKFCTRNGTRVCRVPVELGPTALDLNGSQLAFGWNTQTVDTCNDNSGIWLDTVGQARRRIETSCSGDIQAVQLLSPTISQGRLSYAVVELGHDTSNRLVVYEIATRRQQITPLSIPRVLLSITTDVTGTFYLVSGGYEPGCAPVPGTIEPGVGPDRAPCSLNQLGG